MRCPGKGAHHLILFWLGGEVRFWYDGDVCKSFIVGMKGVQDVLVARGRMMVQEG